MQSSTESRTVRWIALVGVLIIARAAAAQSATESAALLEKCAPIYVLDRNEGEAICDPWAYAEGCRILDAKRGEWVRPFFGMHVEGDLERWSAAGLLISVENGPFSEESAHWELKPRVSRRGLSEGKKAARAGKGVFGAVQHLGANSWSVKYFLFMDWNETAYSGGEGNHEGDWMCIDLQCNIPKQRDGTLKTADATILYALFHNHGRILLVTKDLLELVNGRPKVYLEKGSHEPWPNAGARGFGGWPDGLRATKHFGSGTNLQSEHKVVREHTGGGFEYDTKGHVVDLINSDSPVASLIRSYRGQWGEHDKDEWKWLSGHDATNPFGPLHNQKMWKRSFAATPKDPKSDSIWVGPAEDTLSARAIEDLRVEVRIRAPSGVVSPTHYLDLTIRSTVKQQISNISIGQVSLTGFGGTDLEIKPFSLWNRGHLEKLGAVSWTIKSVPTEPVTLRVPVSYQAERGRTVSGVAEWTFLIPRK